MAYVLSPPLCAVRPGTVSRARVLEGVFGNVCMCVCVYGQGEGEGLRSAESTVDRCRSDRDNCIEWVGSSLEEGGGNCVGSGGGGWRGVEDSRCALDWWSGREGAWWA